MLKVRSSNLAVLYCWSATFLGCETVETKETSMKFRALKSYCSQLSFAFLITLATQALRAADDEKVVAPDGPWISSVVWLDESHLAGTRSQGLLLRPGQVVKVATEKLPELETVGEAETSLWCLKSLGGGKFLAGDYKGRLAVFGEGAPKALEIESRWIRAIAQATDGQLLAGTEDGKLIVIGTDHKETKRVDVSAAAIFHIALNPAGDQVAIASGDGVIKLFSWPALEEKAKMSRSSEAVWSVVFTPDGKHLVSGGADRRLQLWDLATARSVCTITKTPDWVTSLVAIPNSSLVAAGCMNGEVVLADYATLSKVAIEAKAESGIWSLALSPSGLQLAAGTRKNGFAVMAIGDWIVAGQKASEEASKIRPPAPK
jgi:WD40 repeat protein